MNILLGITGSIAAYKTPELIRLLRQQGHQVKAVLTPAGKAFVTPLTLQAVCGEAPYETLFDPNAEAAMGHINLARWADCVLVAPASADFIAKITHGFADDLLSTLCLAAQVSLVLAPAMNQAMWSHAATQHNVKQLLQRGVRFIGPDAGIQACGETGWGRMCEPEKICAELFSIPSFSLAHHRILITAGPTQEALDPVRYLTNRSSGKMGYALVNAALAAGAQVTLISGPTTLPAPTCATVFVKTAKEMLAAVEQHLDAHTIFISAAAVADYYVTAPEMQKIKKHADTLMLHLEKTVDILKTVCQRSSRPFCVGFAAETENLIENAQEKLYKKGADLIVANAVNEQDIGFDSDENAVSVVSAEQIIHLEKAPKIKISENILRLISEKI